MKVENLDIKNIIFDFGNVIVDLDRAGMVRRFGSMGLNVDRITGITVQQGVFGDLELGHITPQEFYQELMHIASEYAKPDRKPHLTSETICEAWNSMLTGIPKRRLQAIRQLGRTHHVSLLSNTNQLHVDYSFQHHFRAQGFEPKDLFEHLFLSYEMQLAKPDHSIFEQVLEKSGYRPEETLFVDDSEDNCTAFAQLGVKTFCPKHPDEWLQILSPAVATIGFFDGVHKGHCYLIDKVKKEALQRQQRGIVVTFSEHPRAVLHSDYIPQLLTSAAEKADLLQQTGIEEIEMLHFNTALSRLTAKDFMQNILRDKLGVKTLVMGYDHHFGHEGGSMEDYRRWGEEVGIEVIRCEEWREEGKDNIVSSSAIRRLLQKGNVREATQLLGHAYTLQGKVVQGHHVGHELGFPTANLQQDHNKQIPAQGVYAVWVVLDNGQRYGGILNIGQRPTIDNGSNVSIEVNIIDFIGDLYYQHITLHFIDFLRQERKFSSREELVEQIKRDRKEAIKQLTKNNESYL